MIWTQRFQAILKAPTIVSDDEATSDAGPSVGLPQNLLRSYA